MSSENENNSQTNKLLNDSSNNL